MKRLFEVGPNGKKLITFANSADPEKHQFMLKRIQSFMAESGIETVVSIGCSTDLKLTIGKLISQFVNN
jgi:hypothetical protein